MRSGTVVNADGLHGGTGVNQRRISVELLTGETFFVSVEVRTGLE